ncbi:hypothetical protein [Luteolibacter luteus]|uniref:Uncharacterized protein n=1 Tax=Luteolibacter luteus TaxID=2728835 RepID=A0A858RR71_9BACT|nr:hypothetical protein [Luteolibacter luteus]QJE99034.1 hypothetical protein HHL09_25725 [Luteolibacter luteus]
MKKTTLSAGRWFVAFLCLWAVFDKAPGTSHLLHFLTVLASVIVVGEYLKPTVSSSRRAAGPAEAGN